MPMTKSNEIEVYIPWTKDILYQQLLERGLHAHHVRRMWGISPDTFTYILTRDTKAGYIRVPRSMAESLAKYMGMTLDDLLQQTTMKTFDELSAESGVEVASLIEVAKDEGVRIECYFGKAAFRANTEKGRLIIDAAMQQKETKPMSKNVVSIKPTTRAYVTSEDLGIDYKKRRSELKGTAEYRRDVAIKRAEAMLRDHEETDVLAADAAVWFGINQRNINEAAAKGLITTYKARHPWMKKQALLVVVDRPFLRWLQRRQWLMTRNWLKDEAEKGPKAPAIAKPKPGLQTATVRVKVPAWRRFLARLAGVELPRYQDKEVTFHG